MFCLSHQTQTTHLALREKESAEERKDVPQSSPPREKKEASRNNSEHTYIQIYTVPKSPRWCLAEQKRRLGREERDLASSHRTVGNDETAGGSLSGGAGAFRGHSSGFHSCKSLAHVMRLCGRR